MILLIDNFDSFTYNVEQYLSMVGAKVKVVRNNAISLSDIEEWEPTHLVISPGPGYPVDAGITIDAIKEFAGKIPILGICLGHQAIGEAFGGKIVRASMPMHGKQSAVYHEKNGLYRTIPSPFNVTRYHSLVIDPKSLPSCLNITARTEDGTIMGVKHKRFKVEGVQYHPESYMTDWGLKLFENFVKTHR